MASLFGIVQAVQYRLKPSCMVTNQVDIQHLSWETVFPGLVLATLQVHLLNLGQTGVAPFDLLLQHRRHSWPVELQGCSGCRGLSAEVSGRGVHVREPEDLIAELGVVRHQDPLHLLVETRALSHHEKVAFVDIQHRKVLVIDMSVLG